MALRRERRDVLRDASRHAEDTYQKGRNTCETVTRVLAEWRDAELELAEDRTARFNLGKRMLERCNKLEEVAEEIVKRSVGMEFGVFKAKVARLQAQIDLLREQLTETAAPQNDGARAEIEDELMAFRKERRKLLRDASRYAEALYKENYYRSEDLTRVLTDWRDAELELAKNRTDRMNLRKRMIERCQNLEELAKERAKGKYAEAELLEGKAAHLQSQIDLLREQLSDWRA